MELIISREVYVNSSYIDMDSILHHLSVYKNFNLIVRFEQDKYINVFSQNIRKRNGRIVLKKASENNGFYLVDYKSNVTHNGIKYKHELKAMVKNGKVFTFLLHHLNVPQDKWMKFFST